MINLWVMFAMVKNILLSLSAFFTIFTSYSAFAGIEYNIAHNSGTMVIIVPEDQVRIFPRDFYGVRALRDPYSPSTKLTLRFFSIGNVSGCVKLTDFVVETKVKKDETTVAPKDSEIELKREKARYTNHDCETELHESYFDVPLNVTELINKKVKKVSIRSKKYGSFISLNLAATNTKLTFSSSTPPEIGMAVYTVKMDYWLYPPMTVILSAPSAKTGENVIPDIKAFAESKGLKPIDKFLNGFRLSQNETNYYFFLDTKGDIRKQLRKPEDSLVVGKLKTTRTVYGANGPVEEPVFLDVHASMPGQDQ